MESKWCVYMLRCSDNSIYTGISNNLEKRIETHNRGKGARYTKTRRPVYLEYSESAPDKGTALKREHQIKKLTRDEKLLLMCHQP